MAYNCGVRESQLKARADMKVYAGNFFYKGKQVRGVIAGTQKRAAQAIGSSLGYVMNYWGETGNEIEVNVAKSNPGVLHWTENRWHTKGPEDYHAIEDRK